MAVAVVVVVRVRVEVFAIVRQSNRFFFSSLFDQTRHAADSFPLPAAPSLESLRAIASPAANDQKNSPLEGEDPFRAPRPPRPRRRRGRGRERGGRLGRPQGLSLALPAACLDGDELCLEHSLATAHREELRVKELILADLSSQLVQARQALSTAQEGAKGASAARDAAERETAACREAREALRASEAKRERLETALEELEAARAEATADAEHAWQQVTHKDGSLRVPLIASDDRSRVRMTSLFRCPTRKACSPSSSAKCIKSR